MAGRFFYELRHAVGIGEADLRAEPPASGQSKLIEGKVLRCAQDFGSRLYACYAPQVWSEATWDLLREARPTCAPSRLHQGSSK